MRIFLGSWLFISLAYSTIAGEAQLTAVVYQLESGAHENAIGIYVERVFHNRFSILKERELDAQEITTFQKELKPIMSSEPSGNFCGHEPGFAITVFRRDSVIYEASYCFKCDTVGKSSKTGWNRLSMSGTPEEKEKAKQYLASLFQN